MSEQTALGVDPVKQLDYAKDSVAQILTLSSGILAISLTFAKNWADGAPASETDWLKASWCAFGLAIPMGIWALLALTGLAVIGQANVARWSFRLPWLLEVLCFLAGLGLLFRFGWVTLAS